MTELVRNPSPSLSADYQTDQCAIHSVASRDVFLHLACGHLADCAHVIWRQSQAAVSDLVERVFSTGRPSDMGGVDAADMPIATRVSHLMLRGWRIAMRYLTHYPMRYLKAATVTPNNSARVWPRQAVASGEGYRCFRDELSYQSLDSAATQRVSVTVPTLIMRKAPAARIVRLAAIRNRAYSGGSHRSLYTGFAGQNPLSVGALFGFAICTSCEPKNQTVGGLHDG